MLELGTTRELSAAVAQYCLMVYLRPLLSLNLASCQGLLSYPAPGCCFGSVCWLPPPFLCLPAHWLLWLRTLPKQVPSIFQTLGIHKQLESHASCFPHGHRPKNSKNHTSIQSYRCWVSPFHSVWCTAVLWAQGRASFSVIFVYAGRRDAQTWTKPEEWW